MEKNRFTKCDGTLIRDLIGYVEQYVALYSDLRIYVGCDSQNKGDVTIYVTTVVFRWDNHGAHGIYFKEKVPRIRDLWTKLWGELQRSIDVAGYLKFEGRIDIERIDMDYNRSPKHKSNPVLKAAIGYVEGLGYKSAHKPDVLYATSFANELCRTA